MTEIREVRSSSDVADTRVLFLEYAAGLGVSLEFQGFAEELRTLPAPYAAPGGVLFVAYSEGELAGCVGVRRLADETCELKRLFVRPFYRSQGVGRALTERAISWARDAGYQTMRLDTMPSMQAARRLYAELGFREVPAYRHNPVPGTSFLELSLRGLAD